ncbi:MAG: hypothetical protein HC840_00350 [Leptolyngbyaceae cyanobacterium RM2_2_4]|nr:hypothetical protein [Leptolyngbyaceae cyanobacterium RM2_2_4]
MKKALLTIGVLICLAIAGDKIYEFYKSQQPPFAVGECFSITDPRVGTVIFEVLENTDGSSFAVGRVTLMPGVEAEVPVKATYQEIRESGAESASCQ